MRIYDGDRFADFQGKVGCISNFLVTCNNCLSTLVLCKVKPAISNTHHKTNTMYHMHTFGASNCMHVVHTVGFAMGGFTLPTSCAKAQWKSALSGNLVPLYT